MPKFLDRLFTRSANPHSSQSAPVNRYEGFTGDGRVVLRDRRGTAKAEIPNVSEKSSTFGGSDALAIYKPDGAKQISAAKAMQNFTGWSYAAVNAIASEASNIQLRLYQISGKDHKELDDHPLLDLLATVNEHMTGIELKYVTLAHLELAGNAYWLLDGVRDATSQPRAIYLLDPGRMRVKLDKTSFPYKLSHYEFTIDGKVYSFEPYQILHFKYPDPSDPFVGIGIPQTIPVWIDSDNYAMEYNRKYFINGAGIGLYLTTQTNVEGQIDRIRQSFKDEYSGVENSHKTAVLPKGVDLKNAGVTHRDMEFEKLAQTTRDRVLAAYRVSKTILGTAESDTNRATAETADYVFSKRTMKPKMTLLVSYINEFLVPRYGDDLYMTFIDPTPEDKEFRTKEMTAAAGTNVPLMTQNEARKNYLGLGPIDGGDQLMVPTTLTQSGTSATPEGEDATPNLAKTAEGWMVKAIRVRTGGKTAHSASYRMRRAFTEAFDKVLNQSSAYQVKSFKDLTHADYMEHWKTFAERAAAAEGELHKIFLALNAKQKEDVLANLPDATGVEKAVGELFDPKEWIGLTIDLATPVLVHLAKDEATSAFAMIGAEQVNILANQQIRAALEYGISKMARSYHETTLKQLRDVLEEKLTQPGGTSLPQLTEAVDGVYSFADERRASLIAKTESFRAANWANRQAWMESGMVQTLRWYSAEDSKVCQFCAAMEAQGPIDINSNFANVGDNIEGTEGGVYSVSDYGDIGTPPLHPDCRCFVRPELIE